MYDVHSKHADDFISHEEILETLAYADENKTNEALIDSILEKARLRKGLSHRKHPFFSPVRSKRRIRKSTGWRNRSKRISTETGSSCLRLSTFPTTV